RRPVERAEELEQRRLPGAARALECDELAGFDDEVDVVDGVDDHRAAREQLADVRQLVLAHSTVLSASAGRSLAARSAAAAPASRPPRTARPKPISRISTPVGAVSETDRDVVCAAWPMPKRLPPPAVELAVSVGPTAPMTPATSRPRT